MANYCHTYDVNGNTSELLDVNGNRVAHYEYDTFGKEIISNGTQAQQNTYRFSTKPIDDTTELSYFGFRFYQSQSGRWLNRDNTEEESGEGLYAFWGNDMTNDIDYLGNWVIYNELKNHPNYRLEISLSAFGRKYGIPKISFFEDFINSYGILVEAKKTRKGGQNCVQGKIGAYGHVGLLKSLIKSAAKKIVRKVAKKYVSKVEMLDIDAVFFGSATFTDCECYTQAQVSVGGTFGVQAWGNLGIYFGNRKEGASNYRTGGGGYSSLFSRGGTRGVFVGFYGEAIGDVYKTTSGIDMKMQLGGTGFVGLRSDVFDLRAGGELFGNVTIGIIPFSYKGFDYGYSIWNPFF
jgi:RHS repeat-associated protein